MIFMGISVFLDIVVIIMVVLFIAIFGIAIYIIIKNAKAPIVTERAKVISKRSFRNPSNGVFSYRAIFDVKGNMVELVVKELLGAEYRPEDSNNDSADDLSNLATFIQRNTKSSIAKALE